MPALFVHASYDYVCDTTTTGFAEPIRELCKNLTERRLDWALDGSRKPTELNEILSEWLTAQRLIRLLETMRQGKAASWELHQLGQVAATQIVLREDCNLNLRS